MKITSIQDNNNTSLKDVITNDNDLQSLLQKANELKKQGNLAEAIEYCHMALRNYPDSVPALKLLGNIYQAQGEFDEAVKLYQKALAIWPKAVGVYVTLANLFKKQGKIDQAVSAYEQAIELNPNLSIQVYLNLAKVLESQGKVSEAISNYKKAIQLKSDLPFTIYQSLAEGLKRQGRDEEALTLLNSWKEMLNSSPEGRTYSEIWQALNQTTIESLEQGSSNYSHDLSQNQAFDYFQQMSNYRIINLESISDEERSFIENAGLSLRYLKLNHTLVTQEGASNAKIGKGQPSKIEQLALDEGYIYAVCPSTGKILKSNRSLVAPRSESPVYSGAIFYRFTGNEVFYLYCCDQLTKLYLYLPRIDLVVQFKTKYKVRKYEPSKQEISMLKAFLVANWAIFKSYISNSTNPKKVALLPVLCRTPWHQVHNYLAPIQVLIESGYLHKIENFYQLDNGGAEIFDYPCFGCFEEIFPEIPFDKIKQSKLAEISLQNNFFVLNIKFEPASQYITDGLGERMYQTSLKKCSSSFVAEVEEAKNNCFPLLWIGFRTHQRTWLSKVEGITNIVKSLYASFPNIGVVFDGFTRTEIKGELFASAVEEENIKQEKNILSQIQSLLPQEIKIYDIIGCPMHEVILWGNASDLYLAPIGSGLIKVRLPNKPGIVHSGTLYGQLTGHETMRENYIMPVPVLENKIILKPQESEAKMQSSYDFDWQIAYEELLKIALSLKRNS